MALPIFVAVFCMSALVGYTAVHEGLRALNAKPTAEEILLIAGGGFDEHSVEVLNLVDEPVNCESSVPNLPVAGIYGLAFTHESHPVYCSGWAGRPCYKYSPDSNSWENFTQLTMTRRQAASMDLNGRVLITGGYNEGGQDLSSSDHWQPSAEEFTPGPDLPYRAYGHCIVRVNRTHALLTGGRNDRDKAMNSVYLFNKESKQWTQLKSMVKERYKHACGLVNGTKVFVAGGYNKKYFKSVEIFDLDTHTWSFGPVLPMSIFGAASVQLENTFIVAGGEAIGLPRLSNLYEFKPETGNWRLRKHRMREPRRGRPAIWRLPADYLHCI